MEAIQSFSEPIPRKGTETIPDQVSYGKTVNVFQNLFPARGRKRCAYWLMVQFTSICSFSEPIPRKGTETTVVT